MARLAEIEELLEITDQDPQIVTAIKDLYGTNSIDWDGVADVLLDGKGISIAQSETGDRKHAERHSP